MKGPDLARTTVLIVGRRRPWKKQFLLTGRRWQLGLGIVALVVPLTLTVVTYQMWNAWAVSAASANPGSDYRALARQVAVISTSTQAGLGVLNSELGALADNAARLSGLRDRIIGSMGLAPVAFRVHRAVESRTKAATPPALGLMSSLRQLAAQLRQQAHINGQRST
ncbi:MAG: hypothetical protein M0Z76_03750 [Gammaproteobacteria bacterium]|nr:hypothetical protein [Gammaproteobacteria bacterium]